jgi:outer membrane lipoprotein-sorting protein
LRYLYFTLIFSGVIALNAFAQPPANLPASGRSVDISEDGTLVSAEPAPITEPTMQLLRQLEERHGKTQSVTGTFKQLKQSEVFLEETTSTGQFWFRRPDLFRTDYNPPDELTNLIVEDAIYVHTPSLKQVEVYRFASKEERDQQLHSMLIGFGFKADEIAREYEVRSSIDEPALANEVKGQGLDPEKKQLLFLKPRPEFAETSPFTSLKLWIDKETLLPEKIWFEDYNGDKTTMDILKLELDAKVEDSIFEAKFPLGTERIDKSQ